MKSIQIEFMSKKFDDQYTFELHGYLTLQDYQRSINIINQSVSSNPPPGNKLVWMGILCILWIVMALTVYTLWLSFELVFISIIIPILMFLTTAIFIWRYQHIRYKFEQSVLNTCNTINTTENIRGINYRFSKNGNDIIATTKIWSSSTTTNNKTYSTFYSKPFYMIVIEFEDNRYNRMTTASPRFSTLLRYHTNDFVSIPLSNNITDNETKEKSILLNEPEYIHSFDKVKRFSKKGLQLQQNVVNDYCFNTEKKNQFLRYN
ncbi:hypothetical protein BDC45DRAFT_611135 [Circinella umbellata]|nr:hypothetical protein BDC45DRAFT_611135 [Circinella umbellata]